MKVYKLTFRTPGTFLDEDGNNFRGTLTLELSEDASDWKSPEDLGLKVFSDEDFQVDSINAKPLTILSPVPVPKRNEGTVICYILLPDNTMYQYRIVATKCPDCYDLFKNYDYPDTEILDEDRNGRIVIGKGTIGSVD